MGLAGCYGAILSRNGNSSDQYKTTSRYGARHMFLNNTHGKSGTLKIFQLCWTPFIHPHLSSEVQMSKKNAIGT